MKKILMIITLLGVVLGTAACTSASANNGPETKEQQMNRLLHYANEQAKLENQQ